MRKKVIVIVRIVLDCVIFLIDKSECPQELVLLINISLLFIDEILALFSGKTKNSEN